MKNLEAIITELEMKFDKELNDLKKQVKDSLANVPTAFEKNKWYISSYNNTERLIKYDRTEFVKCGSYNKIYYSEMYIDGCLEGSMSTLNYIANTEMEQSFDLADQKTIDRITKEKPVTIAGETVRYDTHECCKICDTFYSRADIVAALLVARLPKVKHITIERCDGSFRAVTASDLQTLLDNWK